MNRILADSSYLFALNVQDDRAHRRALEFSEGNLNEIAVPEVAIPEVSYLLNRVGGLSAKLRFLDQVNASKIQIECMEPPDFVRAREIMAAYPEANLDFVDCGIVALAERLNITQICTFDRRDFSIIRPLHCDGFELLP